MGKSMALVGVLGYEVRGLGGGLGWQQGQGLLARILGWNNFPNRRPFSVLCCAEIQPFS